MLETSASRYDWSRYIVCRYIHDAMYILRCSYCMVLLLPFCFFGEGATMEVRKLPWVSSNVLFSKIT